MFAWKPKLKFQKSLCQCTEKQGRPPSLSDYYWVVVYLPLHDNWPQSKPEAFYNYHKKEQQFNFSSTLQLIHCHMRKPYFRSKQAFCTCQQARNLQAEISLFLAVLIQMSAGVNFIHQNVIKYNKTTFTAQLQITTQGIRLCVILALAQQHHGCYNKDKNYKFSTLVAKKKKSVYVFLQC